MARTPRLEALGTRAKALIGAGIGLLAGLLVVAVRGVPFVEDLEFSLVDLRTKAFAEKGEPDSRIVIAQIFDEDVERLKPAGYVWPWPLTLNAYAFRAMAAAGVAAVVVDVYHLDRGAGEDDYLGGEARLPPGWQAEAQEADVLAAAFKEVGHVVLAFPLGGSTDQEPAPARVTAALPRLTPEGVIVRWAPGDDHPIALIPVRRLTEAARILGFANVPGDSDGVFRRVQVVGRWKGRPVVSLALATAAAVAGSVEVEADRVRVGDREHPLMADGSFLVNFRGAAHETYPRVAPADLVTWGSGLDAGEPLPPEAAALKGKIVVWGINLAGQKDVLGSPMDASMNGPEYQATVIDNLLRGDGRVYARRPWNIGLLLAGAVLVGLLGMLLPGHWRDVSPFLVLLPFGALTFLAFAKGTSIDLFSPAVAFVLTGLGTLTFRLLTEGRRNRWLQGTFSKYLAPEILTAIQEDPSLLELGGRDRELSILFSDVAGFTKISEGLTPKQLVRLLNKHLGLHSGAVMAEGGVVDKFIGDAVMAFWGDPLDMPDHATRACRSALLALGQMPLIKPLCEELGIKKFYMRLGINTGPAKVGNMGSEERVSYTCMGDTVNLASRLEGANKAFGSQILIGPVTYLQAKEAIVSRPIADVRVVGKDQPVRIYELLAMREGASEEVLARADAFRRSQAAAKQGDLAGAKAALDEAERLKPGDAVVAWFRELLGRLESGEEPSPWSGVYVLESKG